MIKNGRVEVGSTPAIDSGKPSTMIKNGEATREEDEKQTLESEKRSGQDVRTSADHE